MQEVFVNLICINSKSCLFRTRKLIQKGLVQTDYTVVSFSCVCPSLDRLHCSQFFMCLSQFRQITLQLVFHVFVLVQTDYTVVIFSCVCPSLDRLHCSQFFMCLSQFRQTVVSFSCVCPSLDRLQLVFHVFVLVVNMLLLNNFLILSKTLTFLTFPF